MEPFLYLALALAAAAQAPTPSPMERGRALTSSFYQGKIDEVWSSFSDRMRQAMGSADKLRSFRAQVEEQAGNEPEVVEEKVEASAGLHVYLRIARFTKAPVPVLVQWAFGAGLCGNGGNSSEPHLHYHLQNTAEFGKGRGLPAAFRDYLSDGKPVDRGEPVKGQTIEPR